MGQNRKGARRVRQMPARQEVERARPTSGYDSFRALMEASRGPKAPESLRHSLGGICRRKVAAVPLARGHEAAMPLPLLNLARQNRPHSPTSAFHNGTGPNTDRSFSPSTRRYPTGDHPLDGHPKVRAVRTFVRLVGIAVDHWTVYVALLKSKTTREELGLEKKCRVRRGGPYK
jgi:hypothetical protein